MTTNEKQEKYRQLRAQDPLLPARDAWYRASGRAERELLGFEARVQGRLRWWGFAARWCETSNTKTGGLILSRALKNGAELRVEATPDPEPNIDEVFGRFVNVDRTGRAFDADGKPLASWEVRSMRKRPRVSGYNHCSHWIPASDRRELFEFYQLQGVARHEAWLRALKSERADHDRLSSYGIDWQYYDLEASIVDPLLGVLSSRQWLGAVAADGSEELKAEIKNYALEEIVELAFEAREHVRQIRNRCGDFFRSGEPPRDALPSKS